LFGLVWSGVVHAAALEVGTPGASTERFAATEYEVSATQSELVYLTCITTKASAGSTSVKVFVAGQEVGVFQIKETAAGGNNTGEMTFLVGAAQKWKNTVGGTGEWNCHSVYQATGAAAGVEGKAGKEGKEGKEGPTGPKGETGAAGPSGKVEWSSADGTQIDEDVSAVTNGLWYLVGAMIASLAALLLYFETRQRG
jgi:hypothetical protein